MEVISIKKGDVLEGEDLLVEKRNDSTAKNGKPYLNLTLRDKTGAIGAKLWDNLDALSQLFAEGHVVTVWGRIEEFNGVLQLNIADASPSTRDTSEFCRSTEFPIDQMWGDLVEVVGKMKEPLTKFVCEEILLQTQFMNAFKKAPAARGMHNAWFGGLLEHVHSLCLIADPIITHYQKRYCEKISRDKVMFGLIMHDAGKIIEYDYNTPAFKSTPIGQLTNHIVLGPAWVYSTAERWSGKATDPKFKMERAHLMHLIAAHHGIEEWGSPLRPATLEAILVHHLDNLDAKMLHAIDFVKGKPGPIAGFSERSFADKVHYLQYE